MRTGYIVTWVDSHGRWFYEQKNNTSVMQSADVMTLDYAVSILKTMPSFGNITIWRVREQFSWVLTND